MNIIFGIWRPDGPPVTREEIHTMATHTRRFASDGEWIRPCGELAMGAQAQYTHKRSWLAPQPLSDSDGNLLVLDGRLDNYRELIVELNLTNEGVSDSEIILSAYRRWGNECFERLIGDWAFVLWNSQERTLALARDHAGTRLLHYSRDILGTVVWSTFLDSFKSTGLFDKPDAQYVAAYAAMVPAYSRSPFCGVQPVLPGHSLTISSKGMTSKQFWTPLVFDQLSYKSASDYDAHFLSLFEQAVDRRTGPGEPLLAQLSGGMDSTSIVCMADYLQMAGRRNGTLDTISYYDDSEPSWNERPYFSLVETRRGKQGIHIDATRNRRNFEKPPENEADYLLPGIDYACIRRDLEFHERIRAGGYRSILSGIGGDEFTGGVPDSTPELVDHLAGGRFLTFLRRSVDWCLADRSSLRTSVTRSCQFLASRLTLNHLDDTWKHIPWLTETSKQLCAATIRELPFSRYLPFKTRPSAIDACDTWWFTLRTQPHLRPSEVYRYEYLYPYFDRDLVEFLLRVPQEQLHQPRRRRAMMRRAMSGIVPIEILERKRKGFLLKEPLADIVTHAPQFRSLFKESILTELGYIDQRRFEEALEKTVRGLDLRFWPAILRTVGLETWLRARFEPKRLHRGSEDHGEVMSILSSEKVPIS